MRDRNTESGSTPLCETAVSVREAAIRRWGPQRPVEMVGTSPAFRTLLKTIEKLARFREPVLVTGESGAGKEHVAQALYLLGTPESVPFVSVNCPQFQEDNLTVSELFGHTKGSFTGAVADRKGAFEEAAGGVVFLDEIGDLSPGAQAMLLRTLSTGELKPLGSSKPRSVEVRVIAATNRHLNELVMTERFRYDLFFRLRHSLIEAPPLRERERDWELILDYFLSRLCDRYGVRKHFSTEAIRFMESYEWPGNVRQVVGVATSGYAMADGNTIELEDVVSLLDEGPQVERTRNPAPPALECGPGKSFWEVAYEPFLKRDLNRSQVTAVVRRALRLSGGSYRQALVFLGLADSDYQRFMDFLRHHRLKPGE